MSSTKIDLEGRHAVVTGGATGLGLAITERLIRSGARVSVWGLNTPDAELLERSHADAVAMYATDVTVYSQVEEACRLSVQKFGAPDILVNNAGIPGQNATTWETSEEDWRRTIEVNLTGAFLCAKAVVPIMVGEAYGRIVNVSSISGKDGNEMICAYAASKAGLISLTKSMGKELARTGVIVNCVTPGAVKTDIFSRWSTQYVKQLVEKIPMGRIGLPEEVASMVCWLCSDDVSFSTGAVFDLSGGRAVY